MTGLAADRVTIAWSTGRSVSASVKYDIDSTLVNAQVLFSSGTTKHSVALTGLAPSTKYYFRLVSMDDFDSVTVGPLQTFTTKASALMDGFSFDLSAINVVLATDLKILSKAFQGSSLMSGSPLEETPGSILLPAMKTAEHIPQPFPAQTSRHREYLFRLRLRTQRTALPLLYLPFQPPRSFK